MKKFFKTFLVGLGLAPLISCYIVMVWIFLTAYKNGGTTLVLINKFNEANIELLGIIISIPFVLYLIYKIFKYLFY